MRLSQTCKRPSFLIRFAATLLAGLLAPAIALAGSLAWVTETQHFDADFETETIEAAYPFTNTSEATVTIIETSATCGCTVPTLEKKVYEPGESGELNAVFTVGSRQGKQRKVITVATETTDGSKDTYELNLEIDIPVPVTFNPRVRFWKLNSEAETQDIEITFHEKFPMELKELTRKDAGDPAQFDYEIQTVTKGLKYIVKLTPKYPDQKSRDTFLLVSEQDTSETLRKYPIYAYVR